MIAVPLTFGFDSGELGDHFNRHASDFDARTPDEYERLAIQFLAGNKGCLTVECTRSNPKNIAKFGDRVRYNIVTKEFGILSITTTLRMNTAFRVQ